MNNHPPFHVHDVVSVDDESIGKVHYIIVGFDSVPGGRRYARLKTSKRSTWSSLHTRDVHENNLILIKCRHKLFSSQERKNKMAMKKARAILKQRIEYLMGNNTRIYDSFSNALNKIDGLERIKFLSELSPIQKATLNFMQEYNEVNKCMNLLLKLNKEGK